MSDPRAGHVSELQPVAPKRRPSGLALFIGLFMVIAVGVASSSDDDGRPEAFGRRPERSTTATAPNVTTTTAVSSSTTSSSSSTSTTTRHVVTTSTSTTTTTTEAATTTTTAPAEDHFDSERYVGLRFRLGEPPADYNGEGGLETPILVDGEPLPGLEAGSSSVISRAVHPDDRPAYLVQQVSGTEYEMWWFTRLDGPGGPGHEELVLDVLIEPPHGPELEIFPFNCRLDGEWDTEIVALVHRTEYGTRAWNTDVRAAWRLDISTEKIYPLPTAGIDCMS